VPPLTALALASAAFAAGILVIYLVRRPMLHRVTKVWLLFGVGILPLTTAAAGNVEGYYEMKHRSFCGSCHVMIPHANDSNDRTSTSLASRHARNKQFGDENCYACHSDYGMYGTVTTKLGGMGHVWYYYTEYRNTPLDEAKKTIHLKKPFPNENCMQCHSTENTIWNDVPDHRSSLDDVRAGRISCASSGCHGFAHPFTKSEEDQRLAADALAAIAAKKAAAKAGADGGADAAPDGGAR
jgi:cytochrome c-type protein NapC